MKLFTLFVLAASLLLVGCDKKPDSGTTTTPPSTNK
jgi:uncharacterized lipoprotein YajG